VFIRRHSTVRPHLEWRIRLFSGAAVLALVGMFAEVRGLVWAAIALLLIAFLLRFAPSPANAVAGDPAGPDESPGHPGSGGSPPPADSDPGDAESDGSAPDPEA